MSQTPQPAQQPDAGTRKPIRPSGVLARYWRPLPLIAVLVLGIGAYVIQDLYRSGLQDRSDYARATRGLELISELQYQAQEARRTLLYALVTPDANQQVGYADQSRMAEKQVDRAIGQSRVGTDAEQLAGIERLEKSWRAYLTVRDELIASMLEGHAREAVERDLKDGVPAFNRVRDDLQAIQFKLKKEADVLQRQLETSFQYAVARTGLILALLLGSAYVGVQMIQRGDVLKLAQASELRLRKDLEAITEELLVLDAGVRVQQWNEAAVASWGRPRLAMVGRPLLAAFPELDSTPLVPAIRAALDSGQATVLSELRLRAAAGTRFYQARVFPFNGEATVFLTDITARKISDAELRRSREKFETLVNSIDGIVWEWCPQEQRFTFVSRQCERLLGYPASVWISDPEFWNRSVHPDDLARATQACADATTNRKPYSYDYRMIAADQRVVWIRESGVVLVENDRSTALHGIFLDITEQKCAAEKLADLNERLVESSRSAGMAEVATGVLHNVGNVLNSVSVSATIVSDNIRKSKVPNLARAAAMLDGRNGSLADFLTNDPKGIILPVYLRGGLELLQKENDEMIGELRLLTSNIEHIKQIITMQQSHARMSGMNERMELDEMVEDALQINASAHTRHQIQVIRRFDPVPPVIVDRHKVVQILINLLSNAKFAMDHVDTLERRLEISIATAGAGRVVVTLRDHGCGIRAEHLGRIFQHGFTTRKDGHGFGLHSGANAAKEMGGSLSAHSDGPGKGATFTLELPVATEHTPARTTTLQPPLKTEIPL